MAFFTRHKLIESNRYSLSDRSLHFLRPDFAGIFSMHSIYINLAAI